LVDEIKGHYGAVVDLKVNSKGNRYYLFDRSSDSIVINGNPLFILPKDTLLSSPYYFGRSYFVGMGGDAPIFIKKPGGEISCLTDSSIIVIKNFQEDTLITSDTFFINENLGSGSDLLLLEYNFEGVRIKSKHWQSPHNSWAQCNSMLKVNNSFFISGEYGGNTGGFLLDGHILDIGSGNGNGFIGKMNNEKTVEWLRDVSGFNYQINNLIAVNKKNQILLTGSSASSFITFCDDSLENQAIFDWGTDFLYFVQFDSTGQCIHKKTIDYKLGNTIPTAITSLSDNSFVVSGIFNPRYIGFDSFYLFNSTNNFTGFLVKLSDDLKTQAVFQLQGSNGNKYIESILSDQHNNVWITGYTSADTLQIGHTVLLANTRNEPMGFFAKLDNNLNLIFAQMLDQGLGQRLIVGQDSNLYLLNRYAVNHHRLFKLNTSTNTNEYHQSYHKNNSTIQLYPNPILKERRLFNYELIQVNNESLGWVHVYNVRGDLLKSEKINQNKGMVRLADINDTMVIVEFITDDFKRITKKVLLNQE